jgi:hypothetical protein
MKKKYVVSVVAGLLVFAWGAVAAQAQTATFTGSSLGFSRNVDLEAYNSTCPGGAAPTQYLWSFPEDGVTRSGVQVNHKFVSNWCAYTVDLTITCPGGTTATRRRFVCYSCGVPGCINPDRGYN